MSKVFKQFNSIDEVQGAVFGSGGGSSSSSRRRKQREARKKAAEEQKQAEAQQEKNKNIGLPDNHPTITPDKVTVDSGNGVNGGGITIGKDGGGLNISVDNGRTVSEYDCTGCHSK